MRLTFATIALFGVLATSQAQSQAWNLTSGYSETNFHTQNLRWFANEVKAASKGEVDIQVHPGANISSESLVRKRISPIQINNGKAAIVHVADDPQ